MLTFPALSDPEDLVEVPVPITNDGFVELTETIMLSVTSDDMNAVAVVPSATGNIIDDDRELYIIESYLVIDMS